MQQRPIKLLFIKYKQPMSLKNIVKYGILFFAFLLSVQPVLAQQKQKQQTQQPAKPKPAVPAQPKPKPKPAIPQVPDLYKKPDLPASIAKIIDDMVPVEGGVYLMGRDDGEVNEYPAHKVRVPGFYLGKYEITQAQWRVVMGREPSKPIFADKYVATSEECPVIAASWEEAQEFILKLNKLTGLKFRLSTESEWEYAARGGNKNQNHLYAGSPYATVVASYRRGAWQIGNEGADIYKNYNPMPVGQKIENELGLFDMCGNAPEWVEDIGSVGYFDVPNDGRARSSEYGFFVSNDRRMLRGGGSHDEAKDCTVFARDFANQSFFSGGIRLALDKKGGMPQKEPSVQKLPDRLQDPVLGAFIKVDEGTFLFQNFYEGATEQLKKTSRFYIAETEVTQAQWRAIMGSDPDNLRFKGCDNCPVESISPDEVLRFIKRLNEKDTNVRYRLPTSIEWEFAAYGGNKSKGYAHERNEDYDVYKNHSWNSTNSEGQTHPVKGKRPNELGLYDMEGNVSEFCLGGGNNLLEKKDKYIFCVRGQDWSTTYNLGGIFTASSIVSHSITSFKALSSLCGNDNPLYARSQKWGFRLVREIDH
jgi:formylglycine-generating enzyme required for sulfatase activity